MERQIKVLLAEDEPALGQIVKESLETRGFSVILLRNGNQVLETVRHEIPDMVVLDVMMPGCDGFSLARSLRKRGEEVPIIFLTSKAQGKDVVEGFRSGGDDYLKKPFSMEELIVRIEHALQRRKSSTKDAHYHIGKFIFDPARQSLSYPGTDPVELTHRESELLVNLCENKNEILDRSEVLKKLWGDDDFFSARSMDVYISRLRKKLQKEPQVKILNVRGYGYKLIV